MPSLISRVALACAGAVCLASQGALAQALPNADGEVIPPGEAAATAAIVSSIRASVQAGFDKNGHAFRDAHRKSHGCVQATFTVQGGLPGKVAQGLFAKPAAYNAVIRYSNGSGSSQDDHTNDARGMALKIMGVPGMKLLNDEPTAATQDFVMTNHPVFFIRNAPDYAAFMSGAGRVAGGACVLRGADHSGVLGAQAAEPIELALLEHHALEVGQRADEVLGQAV
jgi:hypothetical protein